MMVCGDSCETISFTFNSFTAGLVEFELQTSDEVSEGDPPGYTPVCVALIVGELSSEVVVLVDTTSGGGTATGTILAIYHAYIFLLNR